MARILIADDDQYIVVMLTDVLTSRGHEVQTAGDGLILLDKAKALRPDVIIVDIMMPKLPGPEAVERLRKDPATAAIPILFLTAAMYEKAEQLVPKGDRIRVLFKPVHFPTMVKTIEELVAGPK